MVKVPQFSLITPILRSLHWLKSNNHIEHKLPSLTYKILNVLTLLPAKPDLCSVYMLRTRSSTVVTIARPFVSSSLQITNRSFGYASPHPPFSSLLHFINLILFTFLLWMRQEPAYVSGLGLLAIRSSVRSLSGRKSRSAGMLGRCTSIVSC